MAAATPTGRPPHALLGSTAVGVALLLFLFVAWRRAWVCDDAYITFRTVENLFAGHGLTWNPGERVQAYTNSLWMGAMLAARAVTGEVYRTSIYLSLQLSLLAMVVYAAGLARSSAGAALGLVLLTFSRAFTEYSTSGLENALSHAILAVFLLVYFERRASPASSLALGTLAGLATLNRLDGLLLLAPALALVALERRGAKHRLALALGFLPLLAWEAFCILYYGFALPNSAQAKLHAGLPLSELAPQGLRYLANSLRWDPLTLPAILAGAAAPLLARDRQGAAVSAGIALHLAYLIAVGGDFMSGRFLTVPLFAAVALLGRAPLAPRLAWPAALVIAVVFAALPFYSPLRWRDHGPKLWAAVDAWGISDEWSYYHHSTALQSPRRRSGVWPAPEVALHADEMRTTWREDEHLERLRRWGVLAWDDPWPPAAEGEPGAAPGRPVVIGGAVGFYGYYLGPDVHLLDYQALGDPLLSKLPMRRPDPATASSIPQMRDKEWRVGHYLRFLPRGYATTLATGENRLVDPDLAAYYDVLALVTRGDLFAPARLRAIWQLNTGAHDAKLERYLTRNAERWWLQREPDRN